MAKNVSPVAAGGWCIAEFQYYFAQLRHWKPLRIALISCVAKKRDVPSTAKAMYVSPLFKGAYRYAKKIKADRIFILSAKYGLLEEDDSIEPYNETLNTKPVAEVKMWAERVLTLLSEKTDLQKDEFVFLAG